MRKKPIIALIAVMTGLVASVFSFRLCSVYAVYTVTEEGAWPESWPKELEPLRIRSYTLNHDAGRAYGIPFTSREQFESAWPYILAVKSKEAPLILSQRSNTLWHEPIISAGVRILSPWTGALLTEGAAYPPGAESAVPDGKFLKIGPPWPDYIKSESGALPEYVVYEDGKWAPYDLNRDNQSSLRSRRARIDIELIVDGKIVDLNRIPLPADTPIIDKRFKEPHNTADAGDGK